MNDITLPKYDFLRYRLPWEDKEDRLNYFGIVTRDEIYVAYTVSDYLPCFKIVQMANIVIDLKQRKYIKHRVREDLSGRVPEDVMIMFTHVRRYHHDWDKSISDVRRIESVE